MSKPSKTSIVWLMAGVALVVCGASVMTFSFFTARRGPTLSCSGFDAQNRTTIVSLTNTTKQSWLFQLQVAHGRPKPAYFITPQKGLPCWGLEFEEGIYCGAYLYRRDSSGKYLAPERAGPSPHHVTSTLTNIVLQPQQALTFFVPVGEIHGLSKVGVSYQRPPASSGLARATAGVLARLRAILHLKPVTRYQGWCETALPRLPNEN
jgi:hypothetical protein